MSGTHLTGAANNAAATPLNKATTNTTTTPNARANMNSNGMNGTTSLSFGGSADRFALSEIMCSNRSNKQQQHAHPGTSSTRGTANLNADSNNNNNNNGSTLAVDGYCTTCYGQQQQQQQHPADDDIFSLDMPTPATSALWQEVEPAVKRKFAARRDWSDQQRQQRMHKLEECIKRLDSLVGLEEVKQILFTELKKAILFFPSETTTATTTLTTRKAAMPGGFSLLARTMLFTGNPGYGKTTISHIIADAYWCLGALSHCRHTTINLGTNDDDHHHHHHSSSSSSDEQNRQRQLQQLQQHKRAIEASTGGVLFVDAGDTLSNINKDLADALCATLEKHGHEMVLIFSLNTNKNNNSNSNSTVSNANASLAAQMSLLDPRLRRRFGVSVISTSSGSSAVVSTLGGALILHFKRYSSQQLFHIFKRLCSTEAQWDFKLSMGSGRGDQEERICVSQMEKHTNLLFKNGSMEELRRLLSFVIGAAVNRSFSEYSLACSNGSVRFDQDAVEQKITFSDFITGLSNLRDSVYADVEMQGLQADGRPLQQHLHLPLHMNTLEKVIGVEMMPDGAKRYLVLWRPTWIDAAVLEGSGVTSHNNYSILADGGDPNNIFQVTEEGCTFSYPKSTRYTFVSTEGRTPIKFEIRLGTNEHHYQHAATSSTAAAAAAAEESQQYARSMAVQDRAKGTHYYNINSEEKEGGNREHRDREEGQRYGGEKEGNINDGHKSSSLVVGKISSSSSNNNNSNSKAANPDARELRPRATKNNAQKRIHEAASSESSEEEEDEDAEHGAAAGEEEGEEEEEIETEQQRKERLYRKTLMRNARRANLRKIINIVAKSRENEENNKDKDNNSNSNSNNNNNNNSDVTPTKKPSSSSSSSASPSSFTFGSTTPSSSSKKKVLMASDAINAVNEWKRKGMDWRGLGIGKTTYTDRLIIWRANEAVPGSMDGLTYVEALQAARDYFRKVNMQKQKQTQQQATTTATTTTTTTTSAASSSSTPSSSSSKHHAAAAAATTTTVTPPPMKKPRTESSSSSSSIITKQTTPLSSMSIEDLEAGASLLMNMQRRDDDMMMDEESAATATTTTNTAAAGSDNEQEEESVATTTATAAAEAAESDNDDEDNNGNNNNNNNASSAEQQEQLREDEVLLAREFKKPTINEVTVHEMRARMRQLGMNYRGRKTDLIPRLAARLREEKRNKEAAFRKQLQERQQQQRLREQNEKRQHDDSINSSDHDDDNYDDDINGNDQQQQQQQQQEEEDGDTTSSQQQQQQQQQRVTTTTPTTTAAASTTTPATPAATTTTAKKTHIPLSLLPSLLQHDASSNIVAARKAPATKAATATATATATGAGGVVVDQLLLKAMIEDDDDANDHAMLLQHDDDDDDDDDEDEDEEEQVVEQDGGGEDENHQQQRQHQQQHRGVSPAF